MPKKFRIPPIPTFELKEGQGTIRHQSVEESEEVFWYVELYKESY
jgi:hypothetical protein